MDLGYSGTDFERPGYADMMAGILCGDVKCVVVKDLSRLGRTYIEVGELLFDTFVQNGIRFVSVNDHYDSFADDAGRKKLLILFKNLVNHMYSKDLGKKIKSAHDAKKLRAEPAGVAPYGYRKSADGKQLVIDGDAAEIVKMIFDMRLDGESVSGISRYLNRQHIPTHQYRRYQLGEVSHESYSEQLVWRETFVSRILRNEVYTGSLVQGKYGCEGKKNKLLSQEHWIVHEGTHEAIVSKEQFEAVSRLMAKAAAKYKHKKQGASRVNQYAGKIICSRCGKTAVRSDNRLKEPILYYYSCRYCCIELKHEHGLARAPKLSMVKLDALVMEILRKQMDALIQYDHLTDMLSKHDPFKEKRMMLAKDAKKHEKVVRDSEGALSTAYTHHLGGLLDLREYNLIRTKIEGDKLEAEARLVLARDEQARYDNRNLLENQWLVKYSAFRSCEAPTVEMVQALISRIILTPMTNEVDIQFNFIDDFTELQQIIHGNGGVANVE
jgi:DNA invertase Pin-like site-specific DNA recombinase